MNRRELFAITAGTAAALVLPKGMELPATPIVSITPELDIFAAVAALQRYKLQWEASREVFAAIEISDEEFFAGEQWTPDQAEAMRRGRK